ncbi:IS30 family transposase [Corynebacterium sp. LK2510]|uniref:IS30 family transposase n=1 Tax=Corynebacterium sp. LK2510 TaxID=3110472 RepID=UPI0034CDE093
MTTPGPYHCLSIDDQNRLRKRLLTGDSVAAAVRHIGCYYVHALNFAHHHHLIQPRRRDVVSDTARTHFLENITTYGLTMHHAAQTTGIPVSAGYRLAYEAGIHTRLSHTQRRILATERRIDFLRLRLTGSSIIAASTAVGINPRDGYDFNKGLVKADNQRKRFIPTGTNAKTYNKLMTALIERDDVIEEGRMAEPALPVGIDPYQRISPRYLNIDERIMIADLIRDGHTIRHIARRLGRSASTISREMRRNHHAFGPYRPDTAQKKAAGRRLRLKPTKLSSNKQLYDYVVTKLRAQWSPEQIAHRIRHDHPDDQEMCISHETIYQAFYLHAKGRLAQQGLELPTGCKERRLRTRVRTSGVERFVDAMVMIDDRADEVDERILPGHWEDDVIMGAKNASAVITLVERVSRFTLLGHLPNGHCSTDVLTALQHMVARLDRSIWSSITWDQGSEKAGHKRFTMATDVPIFFCHPGSPWERGTNENTNGRLRRNLANSSDLSIYSAEDLEMIANIHNHKPRKTLNWLTPAEVMAAALQQTASITSRRPPLQRSLEPATAISGPTT